MQTVPTHVRWRILGLLMTYAALCHFNRISISVAGAEHIMKEYMIDETQMGMVYSSYLFVYTLCMTPGGWLLDRFGPKRTLMFLGFGSVILVPMTGLTSVMPAALLLASLCVIRGLLGVVSSPIHPSAARAVSFWLPYGTRGVANGLITGAAVAGVASTYFVFGFLMDLVGWPAAFLVAGVATLALTLAWTFYATDQPRDHRAVNDLERRLIEAGDPALHAAAESTTLAVGESTTMADLGLLLCNRSLVLLTISYATGSYFQYLFFYWIQYYFDQVLKLGTEDGRLYATIPTVAMAVGMLSGGWILDRVQARFGGSRGRTVVPVCGMVASALLLGIGILGGPPGWVVTCFALAMGALGASEASFWVTGVEVGGKRGGLSAALLNTGGNAGGILAPVITPLFSERFGWQAGLGVASILCLLGAILWRWIDPVNDPAFPPRSITADPPRHP